MRRNQPFVRIGPAPGEGGRVMHNTLRWSTGDGSEGVVALVRRMRAGVDRGRGEQLIGIAAAPSGAVNLDWLRAESGHRLRLFRRADWDARNRRKPRQLAEAVAGKSSGGMTKGGPSEEIAADVIFVALIATWVVGLVGLSIIALLVAARRLRG